MNSHGQDSACAEATFGNVVATKNGVEHESLALIDENGWEGECRKWDRGTKRNVATGKGPHAGYSAQIVLRFPGVRRGGFTEDQKSTPRRNRTIVHRREPCV